MSGPSRKQEFVWARRIKATRLNAVKMPMPDIAKECGVALGTIIKDLKTYQEFKQMLAEGADVNQAEIETLEEIIRRATVDLSKAQNENAKVGLMNCIISANKEISILKGARQSDGQTTVNIGGDLEAATAAYHKANPGIIIGAKYPEKKGGAEK
jgi:hypothetical protein